MLMPKRVKEGRRKMMRGRMKGRATQGNTIAFGDYGIVAMAPGWITSRQIEAARIAMTRHIKRGGKVWIRIFPHKSYTKKPLETRMGKGKAGVEGWVAVIKPDRILFELNGVPEAVAKEAMRLAIHKLPIKCKFVTKVDLDALRAAEYAATQTHLHPAEVGAEFHAADAGTEPGSTGAPRTRPVPDSTAGVTSTSVDGQLAEDEAGNTAPEARDAELSGSVVSPEGTSASEETQTATGANEESNDTTKGAE